MQGRLTLTLVDDRTINTTSGPSDSTLVVVSRLSSTDFDNTTKVTEKVEIGTDGYTGGVVQLGEFKGKLTREDVSTKLLGLVTGKKQPPSINTTGSVVAAPGSATVTPASMANIKVGTSLTCDTGANLESGVIVTAVTGTTFTANFAKAHTAGFAITNTGVVTTWTYRDRASAKFDYCRLIADPTGFVYGAFIAQDAVLDGFEAMVKSNGDAEETYSCMGPHLTKIRAYPIGKAYVVLGTEPGSLIPIGTTFGADELPIALQAPVANQPPNSLYSSGRRNFLKVTLIPTSTRTINGKTYKAGTPVRMREDAGSNPTSGYTYYDTVGKTLKFGDALVAGDIIKVLFASYGSDSTPTQVTDTPFDSADQVGIPARMVPITIAAYQVPRVNSASLKESIPRKRVEGCGEDEIVYGTAGVQSTSYSLDMLEDDFSFDSLVQTGNPAAGSGGDVYDADYTARYMANNKLAFSVQIKNPNNNAQVLKTYGADHPVFENDGLSGPSTGELAKKISGKDLGKGLTISASN